MLVSQSRGLGMNKLRIYALAFDGEINYLS